MKDVRGSRFGWMLPALTLALVVTLGAGADRAAAGEDDAPLEVRIFHVGALTMGKRHFLGEQPPASTWPGYDSEHPLFGGEWEEPTWAFGMIDELIELCQSAVRPRVWERVEGAGLHSMQENLLIARAPAEVLDELAAFLAARETEGLQAVRLEVRALPLAPDESLPRTAEALNRLLEERAEGPSGSIVAWSDQQVALTGGHQQAYIADYDVDVAQEATNSNPHVGVVNLGLMAELRACPAGAGGDWLVEASVRLARAAEARTVDSKDNGPIDTPSFEVTRVRGLVTARPGGWTLVGRGGEHAFFVRVTPSRAELAPATPAPLPALQPGGEQLELRYFDVGDLVASPWGQPARGIGYLTPSSYTPPEPPELRDPMPFLAPDHLVELMLHLGGEATWSDPASVEARNNTLIVRNGTRTLAGIESLLTSLRQSLLWAVETDVEVLEVPADLARRLLAGTDAQLTLQDGAAAALAELRAAEEVQVLGSATVASRRMTRNAVTSGRVVRYLQDYETEIAQGAAIGNPVVQSFFDGLQVDVMANLTSGGDSAALEVRVLRTTQAGPMRRGPTPHGAIELPALDVFRVRTSLLAPLGRTVLLGMRGEGEHRQILLLTPRLVSRP